MLYRNKLFVFVLLLSLSVSVSGKEVVFGMHGTGNHELRPNESISIEVPIQRVTEYTVEVTGISLHTTKGINAKILSDLEFELVGNWREEIELEVVCSRFVLFESKQTITITVDTTNETIEQEIAVILKPVAILWPLIGVGLIAILVTVAVLLFSRLNKE